MDHSALLVWIDDNARSERELAGRLCRRHADALVVPRGWTIDDRRDPIPRLFRTIAQEVGEGRTRPRRSPEARDRAARPDSPSLFERDEDEQRAVPDQIEESADPSLDVEREIVPEADHVAAQSHREVVETTVEPEVEHLDLDIVPELEYEPIDEMPPEADDPDEAVADEMIPDDEMISDGEGMPDPDDVDPDATQAMPWTPQLTGRYSPDDTGPVSGRLLGRAFGVRRDDE